MTTLPSTQITPNRRILLYLSDRNRLWRKNPSLFWGAIILFIILLIIVFNKQIAPFDPIAMDYENVLKPPGGTHDLGTDNYGRDLFSRIISATPLDIKVGVLAVLFPLAPIRCLRAERLP